MRELPDLLDDPERLCCSREEGNIARIKTNGGLDRVVTETPGEDLEFQIEQVQAEMNELYDNPTFEVIYYRG